MTQKNKKTGTFMTKELSIDPLSSRKWSQLTLMEKKKYDYAPKKGDNKEYDYWVQRNSGKWYAPEIYEDDCKPYY